MTAASTSSTIHKARDNVSGAIVCLKKVSLDGGEMGIPYAVLREISLHKLLQHPNVIRLDEVVRFKSKIGMVFECIESSLCDLLAQHRSSGGIPIDVIKSYTFQMLRAIAFCHDRQVLHRDLKPENVFVTRRGAVKLGNFSSARAYGSSLTLTQERVKIWYRCPETLLGAKHYSTAVDTWSIGCILAELAIEDLVPMPRDSARGQLFDGGRHVVTGLHHCRARQRRAPFSRGRERGLPAGPHLQGGRHADGGDVARRGESPVLHPRVSAVASEGPRDEAAAAGGGGRRSGRAGAVLRPRAAHLGGGGAWGGLPRRRRGAVRARRVAMVRRLRLDRRFRDDCYGARDVRFKIDSPKLLHQLPHRLVPCAYVSDLVRAHLCVPSPSPSRAPPG